MLVFVVYIDVRNSYIIERDFCEVCGFCQLGWLLIGQRTHVVELVRFVVSTWKWHIS